MQMVDCTDIKVLLSGLVDDEVDQDTRHRAERHLSTCRSCRQRIDEAEALDELIQAEVASMIDPSGLSAGFEGTVLGRTVYDQRGPRLFQTWTTWAGWLAAAAALALAVTIWVTDRRAALVPSDTPAVARSPGVRTGAGVQTAAYSTGTRLRSLTLDPAAADRVRRDGTGTAPEATGAEALLREDAETLYFAGVLLQMLQESDPAHPEDLEQVRRAMEYDELLPRLVEVRRRLAPADRTAVLAAESVFYRIAHGPLAPTDAALIRRTADELRLADSIVTISRRWTPESSL